MDHKYEIVETAAEPALSIRTLTSVANLPQEIGKAYQEIIKYLTEMGASPDLAATLAFVGYYTTDMENLDVEIGFTVKKEFPGQGRIKATVIPAGKKATCLYKGSYGEMGPVYEKMTNYIQENNCKATGVVYEFYYNSLMAVPESELLTKIMFILDDQ